MKQRVQSQVQGWKVHHNKPVQELHLWLMLTLISINKGLILSLHSNIGL